MAANDGVRRGAPVPISSRWLEGSRPQFEIYRAEVVSLTSTLLGGGDWHWRLVSSSGVTLVDCGGYQKQSECLAAVAALQKEAATASILKTECPCQPV